MIAFFGALTVYTLRPLASDLRRQILDGPDPSIYVWSVNWVSGHLLRPWEVFEGNIFHPVRHAVLLSDLAFTTSLLVAPLRPLLRDPVPLYNAGVLLTMTSGAWAFYRLGLHLTGRVSAALLTGILAAFGSYQLLHVYQLALANILFLALFLLGLHRTLERPRDTKTIAFTGIAFALNVLSSGYYAVAGAVLALLFAAIEWQRVRQRDVLVACAAAAAIATVLLVPYIRTFASLQKAEGVERGVELSLDQNFRPGRDITSATYLYRRWRGSRGERLFPGVACLALAAYACLRRVPHWAFYAASVPVMVCLSLGPALELGESSVPLPYAALFAMRPFNAMMHPHTFAAVARFGLCVLAGLGFARLARRDSALATAAAVLIGLAEVAAPPAVVRPIPPGVPEVYRALDTLPAGPILEIPSEAWDPMIWAARHGRPVLNGASGLAPPEHARLQQWIQRDWLRPAGHEGIAPPLDDTRAMRQLLRMP
ncbi:MAG TPA: hypothetical protein VGQ78_09270, partial [Vicinamibacteria bacterium]|nr:hypothetical protein [Vicinamibacteria bacterium]